MNDDLLDRAHRLHVQSGVITDKRHTANGIVNLVLEFRVDVLVAGSYAKHQTDCEHRYREPTPLHGATLIDNSRSCRGSTSDGAPLIGSTAFWVFGKAITSRSESVPQTIIAMRSTPNAMPPCGGAP